MSSASDAGGEWRESAAFDVAVADYRRAFALAIASDPSKGPSRSAVLRAFAGPLLIWLTIGVAALILVGVLFRLRGVSSLGSVGMVRDTATPMLLGMGVMGLALGLFRAWVLITARRHFPVAGAERKRPTRMRVRWNDSLLVRAGAQGFGSFAWTGLYAWLDTPDELLLFTAMLDPLPIPHAALAPGDLDDLRARLTGAQVPAAWKALSAQQRGLRQVFR